MQKKHSKMLSEILTLLMEDEPFKKNIEITDLSLDSRLVKSGDLFFAFPGAHLDGRNYIAEAIQKGASAVLIDGEKIVISEQNAIPVISIPNLKFKVGDIAARFYDYPAKKMKIVGFTGTSGKTSCTQFMGSALQKINQSCGIIGTLGSGLYGKIKSGSLTTPDPISLQKTFSEFLQQNIKITAMEVSSHSLDQGRVHGIEFTAGVFTNLTRDHLDYHGTMAAYGAAKKKLFAQTKFAVINADDAFGCELLDSFQARENVFAYVCKISPNPPFSKGGINLIYADNISLTPSGINATVFTPWGKSELFLPLVGQFNLSNALAVLTALCLLDIPLEIATNCLKQIDAVPGRMQIFGGNKNQPLIVVDYAHKPDALEKVLYALHQQCKGKLFCVFGCGGERDRGKRPMMAKIAEQYADHVIVTNDNPRSEDPEQIVQDILQGFSNQKKIIVQYDRSKAIHDVIQCAGSDDCILIAGKGAETYQQIGEEKIPFSDIEKVKEFLDVGLA